jgi:putative endonuclease
VRAAGDLFERRARTELERAGLSCLAHNFYTRYGELDLVMLERDTIVFVEVRRRQSALQGGAAASITLGKQAKLIKAAELWLTSNPAHAGRNCRFDVIAYDGPLETLRMNWLRGAFER